MATTKILKVNHLIASLKYIMKYEKTNQGQYVGSYECSPLLASREMELLTEKVRKVQGRKVKNKAYMIIQSFAPGEVDPDTAFEIGKKFAENYLKNEHQYVVTTHVDRNHIHNHIVFNATNFVNGKQFNAKREHFVHRLRRESDALCRDYNLSVIQEPKGKGITQKEYYARKYNRSYKAQLEKIIDNAINNSESWQDFLKIMMGVSEVKQGIYISFRLEKQQRFTRARTLGLDYSEESIKYRILNKDIEIIKTPRINYIDKSTDKFKGQENAGLRHWASKENIKAQMQLLSTMSKEDLTVDQIILKVSVMREEMKDIGKEIDSLDAQMKLDRELLEAQNVYRNSYELIQNYKKVKDKKSYKSAHVHEFKAFDKAQKLLKDYKNETGENMKRDVVIERLIEKETEREILYNKYQSMKTEFAQLNTASKTAKELQKEKNKSHQR